MRFQLPVTPSHVDIDGYPVAYVEAGQGKPVVLVHGSLCDLRYWQAQVPALARDFHVQAVSLRRYWPERWDGKGDGFDADRHVRDLAAFIDRRCGGRAHVVGHSRGGRLAYELARRFPQYVQTLVLADPGLALGNHEALRGDFRVRALQALREGRVQEGMALFVDTVSGADTWRRMVPWFKQMVLDNANTLFGQAGEPPCPLVRAEAGALQLPVLLVGGALSPPPYPSVLEALSQWLPHARRVIIAGSSHGMNLGNPKAFNETVREFLLS